MRGRKVKLAILGLVTGVFGFFAVGTAFSAETLKIGITSDYPPFSDLDKAGKLVGFDVDITNALCYNMQVSCEMVIIPFEKLIPALKEGKIDAIIASMNDTPDRKKDVTFSSRYYHIPTKMAKSVDSYIDFTAENLKDKNIGVEKGSTAETSVPKLFGSIAHVQTYEKNIDMYKDLVSKKIDFIVADSLALQKGFLDTELGQGFEFFGPDLSDPKYYGSGAAVAVKLGNTTLADRFTLAIKAIRDNGKYTEISNKYFNRDIYGL